LDGKKVITVPNAPKLPFSPAIKAGGYIFVSGQVGFMDTQGKKVKEIEAQTELCLENLKRVLAKAGVYMEDVVNVTVFLRNERDFSKMNKIYESYFREDEPVRSTIIAALALPNILIEIDCIAYSGSPL
jgi:2-iminobutanoate/2-iminopropanoate deaminase